MDISKDSFFFLPTLYSFLNGNAFLGSFRGLRFQVTPCPAEDKEATGTLQALVWYGEKCLDLSEEAANAQFPLSEDGRDQLICWLGEEYQRYLSRDTAQ